MIEKTFEFSVAAAAASANLAPSDFNPIPEDGLLDIWALLDSSISSLTVPPKIEVVLGGATSQTPVRPSSICGSPYALATAGGYPDPSVGPVVSALPVRRGTNIAVNVSGGTGATATGRIRMLYRSASDIQSGTMQ